jgi:ProQ/FINO family
VKGEEIMAQMDLDSLEAQMLPVLVKAFPKAFFSRGLSCRPLRVGIFGDLDAVLPREIDRLRLKHYLGIYTKQPAYLRELTEGAARIDLNGRQAGRVSAKEAASAAARLQLLQAPKIEPHFRDATRASCPVSAPFIPPAPPLANRSPAAGAVKPMRAPGLAGLAEALGRKETAQAEQPQVIVVLKKRKTSWRSAGKCGAQLRASNGDRLNP